MISRIFLASLLLSIFAFTSYGQHQDVFPHLIGDELLEAVKEAYTPGSMLSYAEARDVLYGDILNYDDSLSCLYTDYTIYLDPSAPPRQDAFEKGLNAEHIWPRSKGASGTAPTADMHHIMACRIDINNDRGNLPFEELSESETLFWYYRDIKTPEVPQQDIDLYARLGETSFTPPPRMKGDIARSMMYFYTIYKDQADAVDPIYFDIQREDFCRWHIEDPVDDLEWQKTMDISIYQDGKANPFILDCTLAERTYCQGMGLECSPSVSVTSAPMPDVQVTVFPNPTEGDVRVDLSDQHIQIETILLFTSDGKLVKAIVNKEAIEQDNVTIQLNDSPSGTLFGIIQYRHEGRQVIQSFSVVKN